MGSVNHLCSWLALIWLHGCATTTDDLWSDIQIDTGIDTFVADTGTDFPADTPVDPPADTAVDTGFDTAIDTVLDTGVDTGWDTTIVDSSVDTAIDDVSWDPDIDSMVDTTMDTAIDTGVDAPADILPDTSGCTVFGTDTFGYTGCYSTPGVAGCDDIRTTGTALITGDDEHDRAPVGFIFDFYGTTYTDVSVGTNGHVFFIDEYLGLGNVCLPGDPGYSSILTWIAGYWTDLSSAVDASNGIWYQTLGTAPNRRLVVQWDTGYCCSSYGSVVEFTIVLFETTNDIRVCYGNTTVGYSGEDLGGGATAGIQRDLTDSLEYSCNAPNLTAGLQLDYIHP